MRPAVFSPRFYWIWIFCASACASSASFDGGIYRYKNVHFSISPPSHWNRIELTQQAIAFRDAAGHASYLTQGRCGQKSDDVPLSALTQQLLMGTTERSYIVEEEVEIDRRSALHTRLSAKLDGVPMLYSLYVVKKDGCMYDFVCIAPPHLNACGEGFDAFVRTFHALQP